MDIVITGANGAVGSALIQTLSLNPSLAGHVRALVRSESRARHLRTVGAEVIEADYSNPNSLSAAIAGARAVVHLAGALFPRRGETLIKANIEATRKVVNTARAAGVERFVYLSFPGADSGSTNEYLRTKGVAEGLIQRADFAGAIFRVPMILGPHTPSIKALRKMAAAPLLPLIGGGSVRIQPIFEADVVAAIGWALSTAPRPMRILNLVGDETLSYAELLRKVSQRLGKKPRIVPVPKSAARWSAALAGVCLPSLGWNLSVFDVLFEEHLAEPDPALQALPIRLTPLDTALDQALSSSD